MNEKVLPKAKLAEVVALTVDIHDLAQYESIDENVKRRSAVAQSIDNSNPYFYWSVVDLVESVRTFSGETEGLLEQTCKVLEMLGWQVVEDGQGDG